MKGELIKKRTLKVTKKSKTITKLLLQKNYFQTYVIIAILYSFRQFLLITSMNIEEEN